MDSLPSPMVHYSSHALIPSFHRPGLGDPGPCAFPRLIDALQDYVFRQFINSSKPWLNSLRLMPWFISLPGVPTTQQFHHGKSCPLGVSYHTAPPRTQDWNLNFTPSPPQYW